MSAKKLTKTTPEMPAHGGWLQGLVGPWVWLHICCNDGRNGQFDGKAASVEINGLVEGEGDVGMSFGPVFEDCPKLSFSFGEKFIRLCRVKMPFIGYNPHVGSWCWDAWKVRTEDAEKLLASSIFRKNYTPDSGSTILWEAWERVHRSNAIGEARADNAAPHPPKTL